MVTIALYVGYFGLILELVSNISMQILLSKTNYFYIALILTLDFGKNNLNSLNIK